MKIVASGGLNAALFGFVSAAFVFVSGFVAAVGFTLAGLIAFSIRADFGDAVIWGGVFYALAVLSVVDAVRRRRAKRAQRARRAPASHQA